MRITNVTYRRLVSFGSFENEAIEATAALDGLAESAAEAIVELKQWVCGQLGIREDVAEAISVKEQAEYDLHRIEADIAYARERWAKAKAFLEAHGVSVEDELPF